MNKELIKHLAKLITEERWQLMNKIIADRTRYITVVLEDIFQAHNASAVLRTCDCFGVQDVHIIENRNQYTVNPDVALGASKWLDLKKYSEQEENTTTCINHLKEKGYRIVATTPHTDDVNLEEFDLPKGKVALMFGSEQPGLTETALNNADEFLKIPMFGFTESFNISVSASIILHHLRWKLNQSEIKWQLSASEKDEILLNWLRQSIKRSDVVEREFLKRLNN
ncbi:MAG: RNA methyltransferase [Bacteroidales bacterium]|nr:RNA methyltransferase [Bacteroidales bacterium]